MSLMNVDNGKGGGICNNWSKTGKCKFGANCRFKHERTNNYRINSPKNSNKQLCNNWSKNGKCKFGNNCKFKHDKSSAFSSPDQSTPFDYPSSQSSAFGGSAFSSLLGGGGGGGGGGFQQVGSAFGGPSSSSSSLFGGEGGPGGLFSGGGNELTFGNMQQEQQPQQIADYEGIGKKFIQWFYQIFCSDKRTELKASMKSDTCITLNGSGCAGADNVLSKLMSIGPCTGLQVKFYEAQQHGTDGILIMTSGLANVSNTKCGFAHVFMIRKVSLSNEWFVANIIQRWDRKQ